MKTCENCGSRVYALGCVNCDEGAYIAEQEYLTETYGDDERRNEHDERRSVEEE